MVVICHLKSTATTSVTDQFDFGDPIWRWYRSEEISPSVILAWDNQKGTFLTHFVNFGHEGAPNVTKLTYNILILWENSIEKKLGQFCSPGAEQYFLKKKIWTVPLILQFNIRSPNYQLCWSVRVDQELNKANTPLWEL